MHTRHPLHVHNNAILARVIFKPHAYLQILNETPAKFEKDLKNIGGVALTK